MPIVDIKGVGKAQFPDNMSAEQIREFLRNKYPSEQALQSSVSLDPKPQTIEAVNPSLAERGGQYVSDALYDSGVISNRAHAQNIGSNLTGLGEFLPVIGDATAGDEFGRATKEGDMAGMAMAGLGVIPVVGDAAKKGVKVLGDINPLDEFAKFSDKVTARRSAKLDVFDMPTKGKAENIKDMTDLFDYTPEQLVSQMKTLDQTGIRQGGYLKQGDKFNTLFKNDGTSQMIDNKTGKVIFEMDIDQTSNVIKSDIIDTAAGKLTPEQKKAAFDIRKADDAQNRAREADLQEGYKMQHTAPMRGDNPSGSDVSGAFGEDIYTGNAVRYFGAGSSYDQKAVNIIQGLRGKPEKPVTIYRAVPKDVKEINASDWVTTTKEYAKEHMEGEKGWHILSKKVKAKDIATDGNSIHEFGYDPVK